MAYQGTVTISNITDVSAVVTVELESAASSDDTIDFSLSATGQTTKTVSVTIASGETTGTATMSSLVASTEYTLATSSTIAPGPSSQTFTTKATGYNDPRVATNEQWQDLVARVKAASPGAARKLTSADYNWNSTAKDDTTTPFDSIAYWKLPPGHYYSESGTVFCYLKATGSTDSHARGIIVIEKETYIKILESSDTGNTVLRTFTSSGDNGNGYKILQTSDIKDNLTSTSSQAALSAKQGKVLNEKIQAISNYSTSEVDTGATWIDGSPIYKKTINTGTLPNNAEINVAHNISNLGRVIKIEGWAFRSNDSWHMPLPYPGVNNGDVYVDVWGANISIGSSLDRSGFTESYITLYYTKTSS